MASFRIERPDLYQNGSIVKAYPASMFHGYGGEPGGAPVSEATVSAGVAELTGLTKGVEYVAWAQYFGIDRYLRFEIDLPVGTAPEVEGTGPIVAESSPRNRALRDFYSVKDYGAQLNGTIDDTDAFEKALAAVSAKGEAAKAKFKLEVPSGGTALLHSLRPKSYVDLRCHGAVLKRNALDLTNHAIFYCEPGIGDGSAVTHFALRGAVVHGTGAETSLKAVVWIGQSSWITIEECEVDNYPSGPFQLVDCQYQWVLRNTLLKTCTLNGTNAINFINSRQGAASPTKFIWCDENVITECPTIGINVVSGSVAPTRTDPVVDAHITNNTVYCNGNAWCAGVEQGGSAAPANLSYFDFSGNTLVQEGGAGGQYALAFTNDSSPLSNDPLCISDLTVRGNRMTSSARGMLCMASHVAITGNDINAATDDIALKGPGSGVIKDLVIVGNPGHRGSGEEIKIISGVDTTTLNASNAQ